MATGSEQAFSKDAQTRVAFQAKARKLLSEVEKLNKQESASPKDMAMSPSLSKRRERSGINPGKSWAVSATATETVPERRALHLTMLPSSGHILGRSRESGLPSCDYIENPPYCNHQQGAVKVRLDTT